MRLFYLQGIHSISYVVVNSEDVLTLKRQLNEHSFIFMTKKFKSLQDVPLSLTIKHFLNFRNI